MDDINYTTEDSLEGLLNNCSQPNVSHATTTSYCSVADFDTFVQNIKKEKCSRYRDVKSHSKDSDSIACKIESIHTSPTSTALPIMKKSGPHTCLKCCFKCNNVFRLLDRPFHIHRIRSTDKKNEFLKIEPSLCVDSCLCDFCWKDLEKTYKSIKSKNRKEETYSEKKSKLLECYVKKNVSKNKNLARRCSINGCSRSYYHEMTINEYENIKKLFSTFEYCHLVFVQSTKHITDCLKFPFCLCKIHNAMILVMSTCQICGDKLNAPFNTNDWLMYNIWNFILIENNLPLILKPGMFICVTCKGHISKINPGFPTIDLSRLREYILKSNAIRLKLYGESQNNLFNKGKASTYLASPLVVPNIREEKAFHWTKLNFSDPLINSNSNFEIDCCKNDTKSITSTALLNVAKLNLHTPKLELKAEELDTENLEEEDFKTYGHTFQNVCQVDNVETVENKTGIISSRQVVSGHNKIENNQRKLNSDAICSVAQDRNSMNLKEGNQCMNKINTSHTTVYSNETDNSMNSFIAAVEPPNVKVNPVSIKRKQSNVICDTASNKDVKKQKLNEKLSSYEKNSTYDNTTKSDKYKNIAFSSINPQGTLKMTYNFKNKYDSNSDVSDSEMFSDTDSEEILPDCEKNETDCIIVASDDDLGLDSNCQLIKCKFEIKPDRAIEMDKNDTKSITSTALLNVAKQNLCTPKLELKDEGLDIVNLEEENYKKYDNSLQNVCQVENESGFISSGQVVSEHNKIENNQRKLNSDVVCSVVQDRSSLDLKEGYQCINKINTIHKSEEIISDSEKYKTEYIILASDYDLGLDSNCELLKYKFETKPDHEIEIDCKFVPDSEKSQDGTFILNDENILEKYTTNLDCVEDSNCEMVPETETESDIDEPSPIHISVTQESNKKKSTFKIVSNFQKGLDHEILLDSDRVFETASWSEKGTVKYKIIIDDEIKPSGNQESTCIIISDNDEEFNNKVFSTFKINVQKGSDTKILLDVENVEILSEFENRMVKYEMDPSVDKKSICIIIFDNEKEFINKKLFTYKIVSNVEKESDCEMLLDGEKVYDVESDSENGKIKYVIVSKNEIKSSSNNGSSSTIISNNKEKFNNKKSTFSVKNYQKILYSALMDGEKSCEMLSENENDRIKLMIPSNNYEEFNYKKVSDITITTNSKMLVDTS